MKIKKIISGLALAAAVLSVTSCDVTITSSKESESATENTPSATLEQSTGAPQASTTNAPASTSTTTTPSTSSTTPQTTPSTSVQQPSSTTIEVPVVTKSSLEIFESSADQESLYAKFYGVEGATSYNAYVKKTGDSNYTKLDTQLIRKYNGNSGAYFRVDAVGLSAGNYELKIVPVIGSSETTDTNKIASVSSLTVVPYERTGFAFSTISDLKGDAPGAYKLDGTLKDNAQVIYLTEANKMTVQATIGGVSCVGIAEITQNYKKSTTPLDIRIIGKVDYTGTVCTDLAKWFAMGVKGNPKNKQGCAGITFEGIGDDATLFGGGIGVNACTSVEVRNIGFVDWGAGDNDSDAIQFQGTTNVWVHDNDIFYGHGASGDQAKGDGSCDLKDDTKYATVSYNHFWDSGKMSLCGMKSESGDNYISYHHNWFDHSDSRHPRVRTMSVHVYNNYYDGNSKYGVGAAYDSNIFVEGNYFRGCKHPMLSSEQGTDAQGDGTFSGENGGIIKAYDNKMESSGSVIYANGGNATSFDAYLASSRDEVVPSTYVTVKGGKSYNNFDTKVDLGVTADQIQSPDDAKDTVLKYAGRLNHGDISHTFSAADDSSYAIDTAFKAELQAYKSKLLEVQGIAAAQTTPTTPTTPSTEETPATSGTTNDTPEGTTTTGGASVEGKQVLTFPTSAGDNSNFIVSGNLKSGVAAKTWNGTEYKTALKMESSTTIKFNASKNVKITVVADLAGKGIYAQVGTGTATKFTTDSNGVVTIDLTVTSDSVITISKGDSINVYTIIVE